MFWLKVAHLTLLFKVAAVTHVIKGTLSHSKVRTIYKIFFFLIIVLVRSLNKNVFLWSIPEYKAQLVLCLLSCILCSWKCLYFLYFVRDNL